MNVRKVVQRAIFAENERIATYSEEYELSSIYVYVTPEDDFPGPKGLFSEARETEVTLDYERGTGKLLGVEVIVKTKPNKPL